MDRLTAAAWLGVVLAAGCSQGGGQGDQQPLRVAVVLVAAAAVDVAEPVTALVQPQRVRVVWNEKVFDRVPEKAATLEFPEIRPSDAHPADVLVTWNGEQHAVIGWIGGQLTLPVGVTSLAAPPTTDAVTRVAVQVGDWTVSAIGQRSELHASSRYQFDWTVDPAVASLADAYATASYVAGSGDVRCVCSGGVGAECDGGEFVCTDPGGFASGASGFTLFLPRGENEFGFVERITEVDTGRFVEFGKLYYDAAFFTGATDSIRLELEPRRDPDFDFCPDAAAFSLGGVDRKFVLSQGGLRVTLTLVSPGGLRLPMLLGDRWPSGEIVSREGRQVARWRYPFAATDELSGFHYRYALDATATEVDDLGTTYFRDIHGSGRVAGGDICDVRVDLSAALVEFVRPNPAIALDLSSPELLWLGDVVPVRRLRLLRDGEVQTHVVWLTRQRDLSLRLDGALFADDAAVTAGAYRLEYSAYAGVDFADVALAEFGGGDGLGVYRQSHDFEAR